MSTQPSPGHPRNKFHKSCGKASIAASGVLRSADRHKRGKRAASFVIVIPRLNHLLPSRSSHESRQPNRDQLMTALQRKILSSLAH